MLADDGLDNPAAAPATTEAASPLPAPDPWDAVGDIPGFLLDRTKH
jgi:hypothetical protein